MTTQKISSSDWSDQWTPTTPVQVRFTGDAPGYLSVDAAVARLADVGDGLGETEVRRMLEAGEPIVRFTGSTYQLVDPTR